MNILIGAPPMLMITSVRRIDVPFQVVPVREWSEEVLYKDLVLLDLHSSKGVLEIDLKILASLKGVFKTAHSGWIIHPSEDIPGYFADKIPVRRVYLQKAAKGTIKVCDVTDGVLST